MSGGDTQRFAKAAHLCPVKVRSRGMPCGVDVCVHARPTHRGKETYYGKRDLLQRQKRPTKFSRCDLMVRSLPTPFELDTAAARHKSGREVLQSLFHHDWYSSPNHFSSTAHALTNCTVRGLTQPEPTLTHVSPRSAKHGARSPPLHIALMMMMTFICSCRNRK